MKKVTLFVPASDLHMLSELARLNDCSLENYILGATRQRAKADLDANVRVFFSGSDAFESEPCLQNGGGSTDN